MFVRKSQISNLIKREKQRERQICERGYHEKLQKLRNHLEDENRKIINELKNEFKQRLLDKEREIRSLKSEIDKNYSLYQEIRRRELHLDQLSSDLEDVTNLMVIKVQESLQPFYRSRAKIETFKRKSDRRNEKVENIFKAVK